MKQTPSDKIAVRVRIHGLVQGVFYRGWTEREATRLGLHGWVRNRTDGSVEALFSGARKDVDYMLDLCRSGPRTAKVEKIDVEDAQGITATRFEMKPTV